VIRTPPKSGTRFASGVMLSTAAAVVFDFATADRALAEVSQIGPAVINAGPVAITPTAGSEVKYRDNIYLEDDNPVDSWIYILRPRLNAALQDRENLYQFDYRGEAGWYEENSHAERNNYFDNTFSGSGHMEFTDRWLAEVMASWAALHEDRGTGISEGIVGLLIDQPVEYDQWDVGASVQYGAEGNSRLLLRAGYMDRSYQNFKDITRTRDRDETTVAGTFFYPVAPKTDLLLEYVYKDIRYPNPFELLPELDSTENSVWGGVEWELTPNMTSTARLGYVDKNFDDSQRKDWDGIGWSVSLALRPRDQDTIYLETSREPEETTQVGNFIKRETALARWNHDWTDRIYSQVSVTYERDDYEQSFDNRDDDVYGAALKVGYEFRRWANVFIGYEYDEKDSNVDNLSYTDNIFRVGVELSL